MSYLPALPNPSWHLILDTSRWNPIDNADGYQSVVDDGIEGVILRLCVGDYYTDRTYEYCYDGYKDAGIPVGAYVVTRPGISVDDHIERLELSVDGREPDMWVNDAELAKTSAGVVAPISEQRTLQHGVCTEMAKRGKPVSIYTRATWWDQYVGHTTWAKDYWPWMAHYYYPWVRDPYVAKGWPTWSCWQTGDKWRLDAISRNTVDINFMKDDMFQAFKGAITVPEPTLADVLFRYNPAEVNLIIEEAYA